jgi:HEPN domain-containing protein
MAINQKVRNWLELAERDLKFAGELVNNRNFRSYAPHFCHQAVEKLLKAAVTAKTEVTPPYIHNLVRLAKDR